ncbi:MAG: DUF3857 domain-containing protein [bacterium]|nr:DUF3857 domain-containing protein [bacterium]
MRSTMLTLVLFLIAGTALAADMGTSAGHDLDKLWRDAQKSYDLETEDAVLLLESRHVTVSDDGALATRVHRVVWIGTSRGIREYADLRVPWNSATSTLDVEILRTWMDGRWWPDAREIGETAVVHTLPRAVNHADDYTSMRETMLLHDGVELPCIMETAYTIAEQGSPAAGADGLFVIPQRDPAVLTEYVVRVPTGAAVKSQALNEAPSADTKTSGGVRTLTWKVEKSPALGLPWAARPARYEPAVAWSTWDTWPELSQNWWNTVLVEASVSDELAAEVDKRRLGAFGARDEAQVVMDFVEETVRTIHYDDRFWRMAPRDADRVWETGYGHVLDKAVLTTALLTAAGFEVTPVFVDAPGQTMFISVPCFDGLGSLMLRMRRFEGEAWNNLAMLCDPAHGTVHAESFLQGRSWFQFGNQAKQNFGPTGPSANMVFVVLEPGEDGEWTGTVEHSGDYLFHFLDEAGSDGLVAHLSNLVGSVIEGAEVGEVRPQVLSAHGASVVGEVTLAAGDDDEDAEKTRLVIGVPDGGLLDRLPGDVHLYEDTRTAPVLLGTALQQMVVVRVKLDDREVMLMPEARTLANDAGLFEMDCAVVDGWVQYARSLQVNGKVPGDLWADMRALLLEEMDEAGATIVIE